jgi:hypothetical protein
LVFEEERNAVFEGGGLSLLSLTFCSNIYENEENRDYMIIRSDETRINI